MEIKTTSITIQNRISALIKYCTDLLINDRKRMFVCTNISRSLPFHTPHIWATKKNMQKHSKFKVNHIKIHCVHVYVGVCECLYGFCESFSFATFFFLCSVVSFFRLLVIRLRFHMLINCKIGRNIGVCNIYILLHV